MMVSVLVSVTIKAFQQSQGDTGMSQSAPLIERPSKIGSPSRKRCSGWLRNFGLTAFLWFKIPWNVGDKT